MANFYISDLHLNHVNVTKAGRNFDNRPFETVEEMNKTIFENWNKVVKPNDTVYVLGDCFWNAENNVYEEFKKLHGNKILIKGNHCRVNDSMLKKLFQTICDYREVKDVVNGKTYDVVLCHYPIMMWRNMHHGSVQLYGHVHNSNEEADYQEFLKELDKRIAVRDGDRYKPLQAYNVGCMLPYMNYFPRTLDEIIEANKN